MVNISESLKEKATTVALLVAVPIGALWNSACFPEKHKGGITTKEDAQKVISKDNLENYKCFHNAVKTRNENAKELQQLLEKASGEVVIVSNSEAAIVAKNIISADPCARNYGVSYYGKEWNMATQISQHFAVVEVGSPVDATLLKENLAKGIELGEELLALQSERLELSERVFGMEK